jgi:hypothetical protein
METMNMRQRLLPAIAGALLAVVMLTACTPTVKVATDEPITINLNVNIKHEILIKVDKELDDLFANDELF